MASSSSQSEELVENLEVLEDVLIFEINNNEALANISLVDKIKVTKIMNAKAIKDIIAQAWSTYEGLHITELVVCDEPPFMSRKLDTSCLLL